MKLPPITICMTTWAPNDDTGRAREASAKLALASWVMGLEYDAQLRVHVADDASDLPGLSGSLADVYQSATGRVSQAWAAQLGFGQAGHRGGVGASLNAGFRCAFEDSPLVAYFVDDWALDSPFDLTPWAKLLMQDESIGMVRLGPPHPDLTGTVVHLGELGWAMRLDRHHFAFAHRPALYHERMIAAYGWFMEGVSAFDCEWDYHTRLPAQAGPDVVLALPHPWSHIASSEVGDLTP